MPIYYNNVFIFFVSFNDIEKSSTYLKLSDTDDIPVISEDTTVFQLITFKDTSQNILLKMILKIVCSQFFCSLKLLFL